MMHKLGSILKKTNQDYGESAVLDRHLHQRQPTGSVPTVA